MKRAGEIILVAFGVAAAILFALSVVRIPWSRVSFGILAIVAIAAASGAKALAPRQRGESGRRPGEGHTPHPPLRGTLRLLLPFAPLRVGVAQGRLFSPLRGAKDVERALTAVQIALLVFAAVLLIGYALYATIAPPWEADFLADWGVKGRTFWEARGIDWKYLQIEHSVHPDYPPLLPLLFDFMAVVRGGWDDATFGWLNVAFAVGLLLIIYGVAAEESGSRVTATIVTAASVPLAATPWIGIAEGPFIAYATSALLLIRRNITMASIMLGLSAATKNEGLTLIVAVAIALILVGRARDVVRLWPALLIAAPWIICRVVLHLQTDVTAGDFLARFLEHAKDPRQVIAAFMSAPFGRPLFLISLLIGIATGWRQLMQRDRFVLLAVAFQLVFYVLVYLGTPHDIAWHVRWSWERLIAHLTPAIAVVVLLANLQAFSPRTEEPSSSAPAA